MIHVAYRLWGGDGFFAKMLGVSMMSMFENTKDKVTVHVMHNDRLTPDNRDKFCYIAGQYNQKVEFHNVEEISGSSLRIFQEIYPNKSGINASWYPLIVHEVFPDLDKLIFLGTDTVFNLDVAKLWAYDLEGLECPIGTVSEYFMKGSYEVNPICQDGYVKHEDYFNADVILMKPAFFREKFNDLIKAVQFVREKGYPFAEQDALNYLFSEKCLHLPSEFNVVLFHLRILKPKPHRLTKAIYHFNVNKPSFDTDDVFNKLYLEYFLRTPWATVDIFGNMQKALDKTFGKFVNESKGALLHLTNLLTTHRRAFFVEDTFVEQAKQIFDIKPDEFVMVASEGVEKFVKKLTAAKGKKIFYVLIGNPWQYLQLRNFLLSRNFIEGTDFVNGTLFLSEQQGFPYKFDSKVILQDM